MPLNPRRGFWPVMFGIAAAQEFAHIFISIAPEAVEILCELGGSSVWGAEVDEDGDFSVGNVRELEGAEGILDFYADDGWGKGVVDADTPSVLEGDVGGGKGLEGSGGFGREQFGHDLGQVDLLQLAEGALLA